MRRKFSTFLLMAILFSLAEMPEAKAGKFVAAVGAFQFSAENASNRVSSSISGLGSYHIAYRHIVDQTFELDFGYSLMATNTIGGDVSFGVDIGINYFPMTGAGNIRADNEAAVIVLNDRWRPFVGVSFNQRNFQSTNSQYAGGGIKTGIEYQYDERFAIHGTVRYIMLGGPNKSSATQIDILSGIAVQF